MSRKVFWGASNPFITGIFPAWCEILHQSLSRRMVREESAKKGEGERDDGRGGGPGAVMGPLERRGRMEGAKELIPAAAAPAGAAQRVLAEPAPHLQAQLGAGSLSRPLHLRQLREPPPSLRGRQSPPGAAAQPARPGRTRGGPGRRNLTSGAGVAEGGARGWARLGVTEPAHLPGAPGNASKHDSHPPGAAEQRPLCSRSVPLPGRPESRGCGIGEGEETGRAGTRPPRTWERGRPPAVSARAEVARRPRGRWPPSGAAAAAKCPRPEQGSLE